MKHLIKCGCSIILFTFLLFKAGIAQEVESRKILGDSIEILIPKDFGVMTQEMIQVKYPSNSRPTLVYTNAKGTTNIAFNHSANKITALQISMVKEYLLKTFKNMYPSAEWKSEGIKTINNKQVGYMELVTSAIDQKIYNLIFFTELDGRLLICTFNCLDKQSANWVETAKKIMNSLTIL
ncbi:hypothetical protein ACFQ3S_04545 [Mucilaginibacter terrae]|uniref:hypothetical protein n=1 Tax=Mucilaginibacter terrae TaxID=1955052 RepID=UPI003632B5FB